MDGAAEMVAVVVGGETLVMENFSLQACGYQVSSELTPSRRSFLFYLISLSDITSDGSGLMNYSSLPLYYLATPKW